MDYLNHEGPEEETCKGRFFRYTEALPAKTAASY